MALVMAATGAVVVVVAIVLVAVVLVAITIIFATPTATMKAAVDIIAVVVAVTA